MPAPTGTMSNDAYIKCDPSVIPTPTAGYVYDGFVYRWDTQDTNNPTDELKKEFQFVKLPYEAPGSDLNAYIRNNTYVYVTVAFQCPDDEEVKLHYIPHDLITLDIIDPNASDPNYERIPFVIGGDNLISHQAIINDVKYRQLPSDSFNNRLLTVKIPLSTFYSKGMLAAQDSSTYVLSEFNVRVYWHGQSRLYLDYIEIEDSIHKKMKNDATIVSANLNNRIDFWNQSIPAGTIKFFYGFDEPNQPQFDSYKIVQDMIDSAKPNIVSAVYDWQRKMEKSHNSANPDPLDQFYQHQIAFIEKATPKYFAPDLYPIVPNTVWNDEQDEKFVQTLIDKNLLCRYNEFKMRTNSNDYKFYPVVQSFGEWVAGNQWESWLRPPAETQKMLQYLPLCYQADGIINYIFPTFTNGAANNAGQYGPLLIVDNGGALSYEPQTNYYALKEANSKILHYHKDISESEWLWAENLAVNENNPEINLTPALLYSLYINPSGGIYQGYVQCGLYNKAGQPQFMLVNRRANYLRDGFVPQSSNNGALDNCFSVPLPQKVHFIPDASAHNLYGTHIAMYDPYDSTIVVENSGTMEVNIGPGDGMLLQMCGSLPAVVETDAVLRNKVYLSGEILISSSKDVFVEPDTDIVIMPNTEITLDRAASFHVCGNCTIHDGVTFDLSRGALVQFSDASVSIEGKLSILGDGAFTFLDSVSCDFTVNSELTISDSARVTLRGSQDFSNSSSVKLSNKSTLNLDNATIKLWHLVKFWVDDSDLQFTSSTIMPNASVGDTIFVANFGKISVIDSTIRNMPIILHESDLTMYNSYIIVKANTSGIVIDNHDQNREVKIENNQGSNGISCIYGQGTKGINIVLTHSPVCIKDTDFNGLSVGIAKCTNTADADSISNCTFTDCITGIYETSSGTIGRIQNCEFTNIANAGIWLSGSIPTVYGCSFDSCGTGVRFEGSYYSLKESGVFNSTFSQCTVAIESRASNPRVAGCSLNLNEVGLLCHKDSNMNLSHSAYNSLNNVNSNIQFCWDERYQSYIQLLSGHNDFYHLNSNTCDFWFDDNYNSSTGYAIDASKNWYEGDRVIINNHAYQNYVIVESFDPLPHTIGINPGGQSRYLMALYLESLDQLSEAMAIYKAILNEGIESEKDYYNGCIDGIYRIHMQDGTNLADLSQYIDQKITEYTVADTSFTKLLTDYHIKNYVVRKDFQAAIDLIQLRIDSPISEIDSLRAVLDLEIVLQIASMQEAKSSINTKYSQYQYPDSRVYNEMHDKNWEKYIKVLNHDDSENVLVLPAMPQIQSNYPNPFNPSTTIAFSVPLDGAVKLSIYNLRGQKVKDVIHADMQKGFHKAVWDGTDAKSQSVSSGLYLLRLETAKGISSRKVMLLK